MSRKRFLISVATDTVRRTRDIPCNTLFVTESVSNSVNIIHGDKHVKYRLDDATTYQSMVKHKQPEKKIGVLNFASAVHPGGGFLKGSMAQEESLCYVSNLYHTQLKQPKFYERFKNEKAGVYSSSLIVSRDVQFIKNEQFELLEEPVTCDVVITSAAVNVGLLKKYTSLYETKEDINKINEIMENRIRGIIKHFVIEGCDTIILGAYGCGVFKNNPYDVARRFRKVLMEEKLGNHFTDVVFAIPKSTRDNNYRCFKEILGL